MRPSSRATRQAGNALLTLLTARSPVAKLGALVVLLLVAWAAWHQQAGGNDVTGQIVGEVVAVSDGDTVTVLDDARRQYKVRLAFVDAPEKSQPYGQASKQALADLVFRRAVHVDVIDRDRYGRTVGRLEVDERDVNLAQVEAGYAWHYRQFAERKQSQASFDRYETAEQTARAEHRGLWQDSDPVPPWDFRHRQRGN